jgi:GntR family transcriptional regulator, rspAB operon transcriptional repressor
MAVHAGQLPTSAPYAAKQPRRGSGVIAEIQHIKRRGSDEGVEAALAQQRGGAVAVEQDHRTSPVMCDISAVAHSMSARQGSQTLARPIKAIAQTRLTQTVYKLLRARIASHDFVPGQQLRLELLAAQLGVSRTPVREALNQLAAEGLVEIRPRRGTFVAQVDLSTVAELYQLRLIIDTSVAKLLAARVTKSQIRMLSKLLDKLGSQVDGEAYVDYGAYLECHRDFHSAIVRMVGNRRLMALYDKINLPLWLVRAQEQAGPPRDARASLGEHRTILRTLEARDPSAAAEAMTAHLEGSVVKLGVKLGLIDDTRNGRRTAL